MSSLPHGNGFQRWLVPSNLYFLNKYLHFYGKTFCMQLICVCHVTSIPIAQDMVLDLVLTHKITQLQHKDE